MADNSSTRITKETLEEQIQHCLRQSMDPRYYTVGQLESLRKARLYQQMLLDGYE